MLPEACQKLLPGDVVRKCCQKVLSESVAKRSWQKLLSKGLGRSCCQKVLSVARRSCQKVLPVVGWSELVGKVGEHVVLAELGEHAGFVC